MAGGNNKEEKVIKEFDEWKIVLKLFQYLLKLDKSMLTIKGHKVDIENCQIKIGKVPILQCDLCLPLSDTVKTTVRTFFIPIEFSVYREKLIYPIFNEPDLNKFKNFHEKLKSHYEVAKCIYDAIKDAENYIVFFLIVSQEENKDKQFENNIRSCFPVNTDIIKQYVKNPPFMHLLSPIFKCELIQCKEDSGQVTNIINWSSNWDSIIEQIRNVLQNIMDITKIEKNIIKKISKYKKFYYKIFLEPYLEIYEKFNDISINLNSLTELYDTIYRQEVKQKRHRTPVDFLRTPIPFCFWDFVVKWKYVLENIKDNAELKILWIDNNATDGDKKQLSDILGDLLELKRINIEFEWVSRIEINKVIEEIEKLKPHVIFFDFFLDDEDIVIASWFIEELFYKIKEKGHNYWVMITSRYTPAVVKYLESGLLGGYYPNAFIYVGDFWLKSVSYEDKKNMENIIFLYKLIDLLESRIKSIKDIEDEVEKYIKDYIMSKKDFKIQDIEETFIVKLRQLLSEAEYIENLIQLKYSKKLYKLLYAYIIYKHTLPDTEKDLIEELRRRILIRVREVTK